MISLFQAAHRKRAGKKAELSFVGHALMENRRGLVVETAATEARHPGYVVSQQKRKRIEAC